MFLPMPLLRTHPQLPSLSLLIPGIYLKRSLTKQQAIADCGMANLYILRRTPTFLHLIVSQTVQALVSRVGLRIL